MTRQEFQSLRKYAYARKNAPRATLLGRRAEKGRAKGVGQHLKTSRIIPVSIDFLQTMQEAVDIKHFPSLVK